MKGFYEKAQEVIGQKDQEGGDRAGSGSDLSTITASPLFGGPRDFCIS